MKKKLLVTALILVTSIMAGCGSAAEKSGAEYYDKMPQANTYQRDSVQVAYDMADSDDYYVKESESFNKAPDYSSGAGYDGNSGFKAGDSSDVSDNTVIEANETQSTRKVIKSASLRVETLQFDEFIAKLESNIGFFGGYVESSDISGNNIYRTSSRYASYTVRVPQDKISSFINQIGQDGNVTSTQYGEQDITLSYVDVESRIKTLKTEQQTLLGLLEKAEYINDVIELERRLSEVNYDIESYTSRLRTYDNQITFSTVHINVTEVERVTPVVSEPVAEKTLGEKIVISFKERMQEIWEGIQNFIIWICTHAIGIVIWAVIITTLIVLIKKASKKRKARKAAKAAKLDESKTETAEQSNSDETKMGD